MSEFIARDFKEAYIRMKARALEAEARIEALEAALRRIDAINDNPATYNGDIDDVFRAALAPEPEK